MAEQRRKDTESISPKGVAKWVHVNEPQTQFKPEGVYSVELLLNPNDKTTTDLIDLITKEHAERFAEAVAENPKKTIEDKGLTNCFKPDLDKDGAPTGLLCFKFSLTASGINKKTKTPWTKRPLLFDSKGAKLPTGTVVYGGSIMKIAFQLNHNAMKTGAFWTKLRLLAVFVLDLKSAYERSASSFGYKAEEGYEAEGEGDKDAFDEQAPAGADSGNDSTDF